MQEQSAVVIVAAGTSSRMQGRDKLWTALDGRITLARTIDVFEHSACISTIVIVTNSTRIPATRTLCANEPWQKISAIVPGGTRRQDSVCCGLDTLAKIAPDCRWVMVHDAARPFVSATMVAAGLEAGQRYQAAVAAVPVKDTIKLVEDGIITATPERSHLWLIQTPQVFSFELIHQAHHHALAQADSTDDATLIERLGHPVAIFPGAYTNIKITTQEDLLFAEALCKEKTV